MNLFFIGIRKPSLNIFFRPYVYSVLEVDCFPAMFGGIFLHGCHKERLLLRYHVNHLSEIIMAMVNSFFDTLLLQAYVCLRNCVVVISYSARSI